MKRENKKPSDFVLKLLTLTAVTAATMLTSGCFQPDSSTTPAKSTRSTTSGTTSTSTSSSGINAIQIITKGDSSGSFDNSIAPVSGGVGAKATRIFNLDGSLISTGSIPAWYSESKVFLTSTRTTASANPATPGTSDTPCSYFDSYNDNNPDTDGYYTIDGFNPSVAADIDQCAGTAASELNQLGMYIKVDRRFMDSGDKFQLIVKAKPIDAPNTAPTASSCVVGGFFDGTACSNQLFTVSMRTAPYAATKPFYILFPSAKSLDLISESVLLPMNINSNWTTISIDRVKGGAVFYGVTLIKL